MNRLKDKVAIITGAAGGIGAATARIFEAEGAKVIATDVQADALKAWVDSYHAQHGSIEYIQHDVSNESDWKKVVDKTMALYGRIDILVNNAGVFPGFMDCEHTDTANWQRVLNINLTGPFLGSRACIPLMRQGGGGSIVNVASIAGIDGGNGIAYSSSKGGLRLLSKDLAVSLAKDNIRVNTVCPGAVFTPMTEGLLQSPEMKETIKAMSPQGRVSDPVEIAWGILYLASPEASFVTGTDLVIDGGAVAR